MRVWLAVVLLAGCVAPEVPERSERLLLLGAAPCHAGICFDAGDLALEGRGIQPLLALQTVARDLAVGDGFVAWLERGNETRLWVFDVDTRELVQVASWHPSRHVALAAVGQHVWFVVAADGTPDADSAVWRWDWLSRQAQRMHWSIPGALQFLDHADGRFLVGRADGSLDAPFLALEGLQSKTILAGEGAAGAMHAALGPDYVVFSFAAGGEQGNLWLSSGDSLSPIWAPDGPVTALGASNALFAVSQQTDSGTKTTVVDADQGVAVHGVEGELVGLRDMDAVLLWPSREEAAELWVAHLGGGGVRIQLLGLTVEDAALAGEAVWLSLSGGYQGIVVVPLPS